MRRVLHEPLYWIATNAGYDGQAVIDQVRAMPEGHGLNALTGEFGDLFEQGVIDPVRVTRLTIEHAASVAALMLTTEALVAEELIAQPGAIIGFGDLAEGLARPSGLTGVASPRGWRARPRQHLRRPGRRPTSPGPVPERRTASSPGTPGTAASPSARRHAGAVVVLPHRAGKPQPGAPASAFG